MEHFPTTEVLCFRYANNGDGFGRRPQNMGECDETLWHIDGDHGAWRCAGCEYPGGGLSRPTYWRLAWWRLAWWRLASRRLARRLARWRLAWRQLARRLGRESLGLEPRLGLESLGVGWRASLRQRLGLSQLRLWLWLPIRVWISGWRGRASCSSGRHDRASCDRTERGNWAGGDGELLHNTCENLLALSGVLGRQRLFVSSSRRSLAGLCDAVMGFSGW
jgi:hypothetical protein